MIIVFTELLPYLAEFRVDISPTKRSIRVCLIVVLKLFRRRFEIVKWKGHGYDWFFKFALQRSDVRLHRVCLCIGKRIHRASVFTAHLVDGHAGVCP
jgi:hypothetical protein